MNLVRPKTQTITARVVNITSDAGNVGFALYTKNNFRKLALHEKEAQIVNGKSMVVFVNVPTGTYALICYHDKNNNNKMDFYENGMSLESYGASNYNMSFGPPKYEDAKFVVADKNVSLKIKL